MNLIYLIPRAQREEKKGGKDELVERGVAYRKIKQLIIKIHEQEGEVSYKTSYHSHSNRDVGTKFFNQNTMSMWTGLGLEEEYDIALEYKSRFGTVHWSAYCQMSVTWLRVYSANQAKENVQVFRLEF